MGFNVQLPAELPAACMQVLSTFKGTELLGLRYTPLFPFFAHLKAPILPQSQPSNGIPPNPLDPLGEQSPNQGAFRVCGDGYVTADSGTGVVHQAPAFGEDDMRVCLHHGELEHACLSSWLIMQGHGDMHA